MSNLNWTNRSDMRTSKQDIFIQMSNLCGLKQDKIVQFRVLCGPYNAPPGSGVCADFLRRPAEHSKFCVRRCVRIVFTNTFCLSVQARGLCPGEYPIVPGKIGSILVHLNRMSLSTTFQNLGIYSSRHIVMTISIAKIIACGRSKH